MFSIVQVDRLEVINKQYVRVILMPGADADAVRGGEKKKLHVKVKSDTEAGFLMSHKKINLYLVFMQPKKCYEI